MMKVDTRSTCYMNSKLTLDILFRIIVVLVMVAVMLAVTLYIMEAVL